VKVPEDVEKDLHLPLLGAIPIAAKDVSPTKALEDPRSALSEAYYSVRTALQFSTEDGVPSSLLVTSPRPAEGKTTSALAIATGFARLGLRVLLVDGDMRDPSLHKILSRDNGVGLSNVLAGGPEMNPALQPTSYKNLTFLACGPPPPNPAELLGGNKMRAFLAAARAEFDLVVIDGPPVMGLADAPQLADVVVGTVFVIEAGKTKRDLAKAAIRRLRVGNAYMLGAILTKFDLRKAGYAYGHAYGYGYGYGYGYDYGSKLEKAPRQLGFIPSGGWFGNKRRRA
jgi:capsular exopolysaccharide synthesis family protein